MKYKLVEFVYLGEKIYSIITSPDEVAMTSFPAVVGNPNYDSFLIRVDLTDEEVHALPVDEWFEV